LTLVAAAHGRYKLTLSYLQLYMEAVLDLLEPEKDGLAITEDPTTGEVICNGAKVIDVNNMEGLLRILKVRAKTICLISLLLVISSSMLYSCVFSTASSLGFMYRGVNFLATSRNIFMIFLVAGCCVACTLFCVLRVSF
jgi:hypothetical protein